MTKITPSYDDEKAKGIAREVFRRPDIEKTELGMKLFGCKLALIKFRELCRKAKKLTRDHRKTLRRVEKKIKNGVNP